MNTLIIQRDFDPIIAKELDTDCAIILENFVFWVGTNKANKKNFHEGRYWTFNSATALQELFPYLSVDQIKRSIKRLKDSGYLILGNFNTTSYDRTNWYTVSDTYSRNRSIHWAKSLDGKSEIAQPIPDDKPDDKPNSPNGQSVKEEITNSTDLNNRFLEENREREQRRLEKEKKWKFGSAPKPYTEKPKKGVAHGESIR